MSFTIILFVQVAPCAPSSLRHDLLRLECNILASPDAKKRIAALELQLQKTHASRFTPHKIAAPEPQLQNFILHFSLFTFHFHKIPAYFNRNTAGIL
jgi:hypothetical protein